MVIFLFILAAFDLWVGVSNDAVNFLNSAIGSRAAKFRSLVFIAGTGVFCGCVLSNGMMDIARHGIFTPQYFSFEDVMYIYLAVMVTDIVLLDIFNSLVCPPPPPYRWCSNCWVQPLPLPCSKWQVAMAHCSWAITSTHQKHSR